MGKRVFDFVLALFGVVFLSPLFFVIGFFIKCVSSGPVFSRRKKIGKDFRAFELYTFRIKEQPSAGGIEGNTTLIPGGKMLHDLKIDMLPKLINILKGEMSFVGPLPDDPSYVDQYREDFKIILQVRPGMADLASAEFANESALLSQSETPEAVYSRSILPRRIKLAKIYVQHQSFSLDLKVIFTRLINLFLSLPFPFSKSKGGKKKPLREVICKFRSKIVFFVHLLAVICSNYAAFLFRFDGNVPSSVFSSFLTMLPVVLSIRIIALYSFGLNQGLWRYAGLSDFLKIGGAVLVSSIAIWDAILFIPAAIYPKSVILIDAIFLLMTLTVIRSLKRSYAILTSVNVGARRVLIIGAGNAGEMIARDMKGNSCYNRQPVAFLDDDPKKASLKIHGIPVIGKTEQVEMAVKSVHPHEILIAIPSATSIQMKRIINKCKTFGLPIKCLPNLTEMLTGKVSYQNIRSLDIEDLIGRPEIEINDPEVREKIKGKRVLVTGAGGSIGSELCRQIASFEPECLILYERSENNLYHIQLNLKERYPGVHVESVLADILNIEKLNRIFDSYRPEIVFHAAAYKHVPMMEINPFEAVQNNIIGTYQVMMAADRFGSEKFVLISTDKAVYPSSVMGATKRVAEKLVRYFGRQSGTKLVSVRFGNVLESNGSVVPLFRDQIKKGGPVKVTHPDIKRYFITIQEAVQLVLHASILGQGGEVFVLDMGEPIKIADLARTMIILSGYTPDEDIPIEFIGLRPGEKLVEELFEECEDVTQTRHEKIRLAQNGKLVPNMQLFVEKFSRMNHQTDPSDIKTLLKELIPTYQSADLISYHSKRADSSWLTSPDGFAPIEKRLPASSWPPSSEAPLYH